MAGQAAIAVQNARLYTQVRMSRERLRNLTRQVVTAQEEERRRISRELHDEAGQALTALKISLDIIRVSLPAEQADIRAQLAETITLADDTMEQIRLLAHDLRPPVLDAIGLHLSLENFCADFARRTGLIIHYEGVELPTLTDTMRISFYRFLQEALANAAKHAQATQIWVTLQQTMDMAILAVKDDGKGFSADDGLGLKHTTGVGLPGMQERFELLGGQLEIRSTPDLGTALLASVPLDREQEGVQ
jgi:signal transduction histidine kinase